MRLSKPSLLRSRRNPGEPFVGLRKYKNYWSDNLISRAKRFFRPFKAYRLIGTSTYYHEEPEKIHPDIVKKIYKGFYLVPSSALTWANLAILVDRDVYLEKIIKKAEQTKSKKHIPLNSAIHVLGSPKPKIRNRLSE